MKKMSIMAMLLLHSVVFAQQKNTLLDRSFWKTNTSILAVQHEIDKGNSPSQLDFGAFDPTSIAIMQGAPTETIEFLLNQGGNYVDKLTHDGRTYLHWAAMNNNVELVNRLISKGFDVNLKDTKGAIPLTFAAERGIVSVELLEAFFKAGIDPKATYKNGENLLHLTIANDKDLKIANFLQTKGLSLKDTDNQKRTLFDYAAQRGNIELMKTLRKKGIKPTSEALILAAQGGRRFTNKLEVYQYLVEEMKIKPSATDKNGRNVLHFIARNENQTEIVKYFLEKKVSVNQQDKEGNTPFLNATRTKDVSLLELLLPSNNINHANKSGMSALANAVLYGTPQTMEFLLNNKADTKHKDLKGNNLAYYWVEAFRPNFNEKAQKEYDQKLQLLLKNGVDFSASQADGSLYHSAIMKENLWLVQKLASLNINLEMPNKSGETPLLKAALISKNDEILKYLISIGANKNAKTEFGETAYDLASENEMLKLRNISVEFLK